MKRSYVALMAMILAGVLAWVWSREMSQDAQASEQALRALDSFVIAESELHRDVLQARAGILRNYDPMVAEIQALRAALKNIPDNGRLGSYVDREEDLTERFKTNNSLLQNSLAYFELFSTRLMAHRDTLSQQVSELTGAMLQLTLDTSPAVVSNVDRYLTEVSSVAPSAANSGLVDSLLAHGRVVRDVLPTVDGLLKSLLAIPSAIERVRIRNRMLEQAHTAAAHARHARYALIGTSLLLLALLVQLGMQLRQRALALRRRAALEHLIAGISTRFINSRAQEMDSQIELALADLAQFIHADRAYFVVEGSPGHLYKWCRPGVLFPPQWPEGAVALTREVSTDARGVIEFRDIAAVSYALVRETLSNAGVSTWLCVPSNAGEALAGLLAFDSVGPHEIIRSRELSLLRMALDAMSNAIDRRHLEHDRERLETNLQHARRMETIGALASGIAHNFNNIVGAILGFTESAQLQLQSGARAGGSLNEIRRAGERARDLVDQILTFGRRRTVRRTRISVHEWIEEARLLLVATLPPHVRLVVRERVAEIWICGELTSLQQVILNLCNNAAQAMDSAGTIEIATGVFEARQENATEVVELPRGQYLQVSVTDPGRGMDEATLERIFEPFFTTRSEGNGLGLALVREIILEHGGTVRVRSAPGKGTQVNLWIPTLSAAALYAAETDTFESIDRGRGETILVVESNRERLLRHEEILAALGYEPAGFLDADEAEAACIAEPTRFDAAIYSSRLHDGATVLAQAAKLGARMPKLPILLASTSPGQFLAPVLADAGIAEVIRQPLNSAEIATALARVLAARPATLRAPQPLLQM